MMTNMEKKPLRDDFELCKLDMCPSKSKCLRHSRGGYASESASHDRYGSFGLIPGEMKCPAFVPLSQAHRHTIQENEEASPATQNDDYIWLFDLWAELNAHLKPFVTNGNRLTTLILSPPAWASIEKLAENYEKIMILAARQAIMEAKK